MRMITQSGNAVRAMSDIPAAEPGVPGMIDGRPVLILPALSITEGLHRLATPHLVPQAPGWRAVLGDASCAITAGGAPAWTGELARDAGLARWAAAAGRAGRIVLLTGAGRLDGLDAAGILAAFRQAGMAGRLTGGLVAVQAVRGRDA